MILSWCILLFTSFVLHSILLSCCKVVPCCIFIYFFKNSFCSQVPVLRPGGFTLCSIFGRMPGIEPELLRPQPGVLPMSYTHNFLFFSIFLSYCIFLSWCILLSCCILFTSFCPTAYFCPFASFCHAASLCPAASFCPAAFCSRPSVLLHFSVFLSCCIFLSFCNLLSTPSFFSHLWVLLHPSVQHQSSIHPSFSAIILFCFHSVLKPSV